MTDYRVNLDVYNGPLDLLLYLIRRDEVDIYDIPIARVTEQYLGYVDMLHAMDPNLAGEFLVMAATLMEIKTRMLLPTAPVEEGEASDLEIDPRTELVRQLLEYKAFKDAAGDLRDAAEVQSQRFARRPVQPDLSDHQVDLEDVQIWTLLDAFSNILQAIGADKPTHEVIYDDTPIELHAEDILDRLGRDGPMTFQKVFEGRTERTQLLGLFLAILELVRLKKILVRQEQNFADISLQLNPNAPENDNEGHALTPANLDVDSRSEDEQPMMVQDVLAPQAAVATDEEILDPTAIFDQETDEDEDELDDDLDDDFDEDDDADDDEDNNEDWLDKPEDAAKPGVSAEAGDVGQYISETPTERGQDDDSGTTVS